MENNAVEEGNKIIAEFCGFKRNDGYSGDMARLKHWNIGPYGWFDDEHLEYHSNWSWLMPVVEKIETMHTEFDGYFGVHICSNGCSIAGTRLNTSIENPHYAYFNDVTHESKLSSTWICVVQFIKWYSQLQAENK